MADSNYPAYYTQSQGKRLEGYAFQNGKRIHDLMSLVKNESTNTQDKKTGIPLTRFHKLSTKNIPLTYLTEPYIYITTDKNRTPSEDFYSPIGYVYGTPSYVQYNYDSDSYTTDIDYSNRYIVRFPYAKLPKYILETGLLQEYQDIVPINKSQNICIQDAITGLIFEYNFESKYWESTIYPSTQPGMELNELDPNIIEDQINVESIAISYSYFNKMLSSFYEKITSKIGTGAATSQNIRINVNGEEYSAESNGDNLVIELSHAFDKYVTSDELPSPPDLSLYAKKSDIPAVPDLSGYAKTSDLPDMSQYAKKSELPDGVDLSEYAKKSEIPSTPDLTPYALKTDIPTPQDLSGYAKKEDIPTVPDMSEYVKKEEMPDTPDLSAYALKSDIPAAPDLSAYAKKTDIPAIPTALANPAKIIFTGAVTGEYDGSKQVEINIPEGGSSDVSREEFEALKALVESLSNKSGQSPVVEGILKAGQTEIIITSDLITENSVLRFSTSIYGVKPTDAHAEKGKVTLTFEPQDKDMTVGVQVV